MIAKESAALHEQVDVAVVVFHGGILWGPRLIADYPAQTAHHAIDTGADSILGHHAHVPKAIEVYRGKVCFAAPEILSCWCRKLPPSIIARPQGVTGSYSVVELGIATLKHVLLQIVR